MLLHLGVFHYMPWYVSWALTPPNDRLGAIYSLPHTSSCWTESSNFLSTGTPDSPVRTRHTCSLSGACHVSRLLNSVAVDHWIRPLTRLSGAHRTIRCYGLRAPFVGLSAQIVRVSHRRVRCTPDMYCSLSGAPPGPG